MIVENALGPTEAQIKEIQAPGPDQPICLINMLRYREVALYPDGRETSLNGKEAYEIYAKAVEKMLPEFGGKIVFVGDVTYLRMGGGQRAQISRAGRSTKYRNYTVESLSRCLRLMNLASADRGSKNKPVQHPLLPYTRRTRRTRRQITTHKALRCIDWRRVRHG